MNLRHTKNGAIFGPPCIFTERNRVHKFLSQIIHSFNKKYFSKSGQSGEKFPHSLCKDSIRKRSHQNENNFYSDMTAAFRSQKNYWN